MTALATAPTTTTEQSSAPSWRDDVAAAVPGWIAGRFLVGTAWILNAVLVDWRRDGVNPVTTDQGLYAWDGAYYGGLAEFGYHGVTFDGIRFHPLVAMIGHNRLGVLLLANVAAFVAAALIHRLVVDQLGDRDMARRAATLVGIAPPAFSMVWAYAEAPFLVLAAVQLLALRHRRFWLAGAAAALATLTRPSGLLLAVPAAVEGARGWLWDRAPDRAGVAGRVVAVLAPVAAMAGYLVWVEDAVDDGWLPVRIQSTLRGGFVFPPVRLLEGIGEVFTDPLGDGLHVPFAIGMVLLCWVSWKRLPASWTALAVVSTFVNLGAGNLNSIERYAYGTVPMLVALAAVCGGRWWRPTVLVCVTGFLGMTVLAWYGSYVP